jgi:hypothetical protein
MNRQSRLRPSFAALAVALGTALSVAACSESAEPDGGAGTSGVGGTTSAGGTSAGAGSGGTTTGGAGAGGGSTGGAGTGGMTSGGTGGAGAGGTSTAGVGGSTGGAGAGGAGTAGVGGSLGGAGAGGTAGLGTGGAGTAGAGGAGTSGSGGSAGSATAEDHDPQPEDFTCIRDWQRVSGFRITNLLGHTDEAIAVAESATGGVYPVGTVIQHLPTEAMVKRGAGFSPDTRDWEFFLLTLSASGATIMERGTTMIETAQGETCASCHSMPPDEFDFVCNIWADQTDGTCGFDFSDSVLNNAMDPRCD